MRKEELTDTNDYDIIDAEANMKVFETMMNSEGYNNKKVKEKKMENLELKVKSTMKNEEIQGVLEAGNKLTDAQIEKSLNYELLSEEEKNEIAEFNKKINIEDSTQVIQYGANAQLKISEFSDKILDGVKTSGTGQVGDLLANLVSEIKAFDSNVSKENPTGIAKIFFSAKKQLRKLIAKYNKIENNVDTIEEELENHKIQMLKDITIFDTMYQKNLEYFKEISMYIIAGEKKIEEVKNEVLPELSKVAQESGEQLDIQKVTDMENMINRFEKKLHDLKTTRIISIQMAPQIRLLQNNEAELVEKIQSSLINTIPLWKNQIILALGINNAKQAIGAQRAVSDLTNEMLKKNSELLKQSSIEVAQESERAIVDVETLQKSNQDIIETLDKVIEIHETGRTQRLNAEKELLSIEQELKNKMLELSIKKTNEEA